MKRNRGLHLFAVLLAMTVLLSTLAGCGGGKNNNGGSSSANTGGESLPTASQGDGQQASSDEQVYIAHVSSTEELLLGPMNDMALLLSHIAQTLRSAKTAYAPVFDEYRRLNSRIRV